MKRLAKHIVQKYLCEASWGWKLFRAGFIRRFVSRRGDQPGFVHAREEILERQKILRSMLRSVPYWVLGHARLGVSELELQQYADKPLPPRARATVRVSAEAVERLCVELGEPGGRAALEAEFLRASLRFIDQEFPSAAETFNRLLEPAHAVQLDERVYRMALENAKLCASVL